MVGYKAWGAILACRLSQQGVLVASLDYRNYPQVVVGGLMTCRESSKGKTLPGPWGCLVLTPSVDVCVCRPTRRSCLTASRAFALQASALQMAEVIHVGI